MKDMKWWMIALCMCCVLGGLVGAAIGCALWFPREAKLTQPCTQQVKP